MTQFFPVNEEALAEDYKRDQEGPEDRNNATVLFLKKGLTQVRVLPPYSDTGKWYREYKEHGARVDGKFTSFTCPENFGDSCSFCTKGRELYNEGGEENIAIARTLRPKSSFLFNVIVYAAPDSELNIQKGVLALKTGAMVKRALLDLDQDHAGGWGDITNLEKGIDIRIERRGDGLNTEYIVKGMPQRTNIMDRLTNIDLNPDEVLQPVDLDSLFPPRNEDDIKVMLRGILGENPFDEDFSNKANGEAPQAPVETAPDLMPDIDAPPSN